MNVKSQNFVDADSSDEGDDFEGEEGVTDSRTKIAEAFANDDDILRDFKKEAQEKAKAKRALNKRPADMPGWGSWAGSDADMKKKRKRTRNKHRDALAEKAGKKPKVRVSGAPIYYVISFISFGRSNYFTYLIT